MRDKWKSMGEESHEQRDKGKKLNINKEIKLKKDFGNQRKSSSCLELLRSEQEHIY